MEKEIIPINTADDFNNKIRKNLGGTYDITADIDLSKFDSWKPIGTDKNNPFTGKINGNGHLISGLNVSASGINYSGLFGYCSDASIQDLYVSGKVTGGHETGGIAGHFEKTAKNENTCHISNCHFNGNVAGLDNVGGSVGLLHNASVCQCSKKGKTSHFKAALNLGGIAGRVFTETEEPSIVKCFHVGIVSSWACGGIVGYYEAKTEQPIEGIVDCYHYGDINSNTRAGGICGHAYNLIAKNCYGAGSIPVGSVETYRGGIIGSSIKSSVISSFSAFTLIQGDACDFIIGKYTVTNPTTNCFTLSSALLIEYKKYKKSNQALKRYYKTVVNNQDFFFNTLGWDKNTWQLDNSEYPYPHIIQSGYPIPTGFEQPIDYAYDYVVEMSGEGTLEKPYLIVQAEQIIFIKNNPNHFYVQKMDIDFTQIYSSNNKSYWAPIGNLTNPFTGHYDGGGFKIILDIDQCNQDDVGLFGVIGEEGKVVNLQISGRVNGRNNVGAVAGYNRGTVENCLVDALVKGSENIGGIVGSNQGGIIINSFSSENTSVDGKFKIGGIVGENAGCITQCYTRGTVSGISSVGGIAGINYLNSTNKLISTESNINGIGYTVYFNNAKQIMGITKCVAINSEIYAQSIALCGRIAGENYSSCIQNFASDKLTIVEESDKHGTSTALNELQTKQFWSDIIGNESGVNIV